MKWFGKSWGAPVCTPESHIEVPLGASCEDCGREFCAEDQGFLFPVLGDYPIAQHRDCLMESLGLTKP